MGLSEGILISKLISPSFVLEGIINIFMNKHKWVKLNLLRKAN